MSRLKHRVAGMKCVALSSEGDRALVDAAIQQAHQQGAMVSQNHKDKLYLASLMFKISGNRVNSHYD